MSSTDDALKTHIFECGKDLTAVINTAIDKEEKGRFEFKKFMKKYGIERIAVNASGNLKGYSFEGTDKPDVNLWKRVSGHLNNKKIYMPRKSNPGYNEIMSRSTPIEEFMSDLIDSLFDKPVDHRYTFKVINNMLHLIVDLQDAAMICCNELKEIKFSEFYTKLEAETPPISTKIDVDRNIAIADAMQDTETNASLHKVLKSMNFNFPVKEEGEKAAKTKKPAKLSVVSNNKPKTTTTTTTTKEADKPVNK